MKWLHLLFNERCPKCKQVLHTSKSNALRSTVVKVCPSNHYQKEFHPALETYVESDEVL